MESKLMPYIHYLNEQGEDVYIDMTGKTIEQIDSTAAKVKRSIQHASMVEVSYEGALYE